MTLERFKNLMKFAQILGIQTLGDLAQYKSKKEIATSAELYLKLYADALIIKNVPYQNLYQSKVS